MLKNCSKNAPNNFELNGDRWTDTHCGLLSESTIFKKQL